MTFRGDRFFIFTENSAIGRSAYLLSFLVPGCAVLLFLWSRIIILALLPLFAYFIFVAIALTRRQTVWESLAFPRKVNQVSVLRKSGFLRPSRFCKVRVQLTDGRHYSFLVPKSHHYLPSAVFRTDASPKNRHHQSLIFFSCFF